MGVLPWETNNAACADIDQRLFTSRSDHPAARAFTHRVCGRCPIARACVDAAIITGARRVAAGLSPEVVRTVALRRAAAVLHPAA